MSTVEIPGIRFSGFYYGQILQDLLIWMRANVPEITDEDPHEPFIQLLRAYAGVGHLSHSLLDHVAQETLLTTARLRESVRGHLRLINYTLDQPTPSRVDLVLTLSSIPATDTTIPALAKFATPGGSAGAEVVFEVQAEVPILASDRVTCAWDYDGGVFTDITDGANGAGFTPWGGNAAAGDALYVGHETTMWDKVKLVTTDDGGIWAANDHVWEYHDGELNDTSPTSVTVQGGGGLRVVLTSLLGTGRRTGATVRVRSQITGQYQDVTSAWTGAVNYCDVGALGQATPSTAAADYIVGTAWKEPADLVEKSDSPGKTVTFALPESPKRRWAKTEVNGVSAYWLRLRVINGGGSPAVESIAIDDGKQYVKVTASQGETTRDVPAGSSTGLADQTFVTGRPDIVGGTLRTFVNEGSGLVEWVAADDFLSSPSTARHFTADYDSEGRGIVTFGDGVNGRIPPNGVDNVEIEYRYGCATNGNIGPGEVKVNRTGFALVASVTNPRAASGWKPADGADEADLERVKIAGPASLRTLRRALTVADVEELAPDFAASDGAEPVARALGVEEGLGPKTVKLLVVSPGGGSVPAEYLTEIDTYFNGDPVAETPGVLVLNSRVGSMNFTPRSIAVTATVTGGSVSKIEAALKAYLHPLAVDADGVFLHAFGGKVYRAALNAVIFAADPGQVRNVVLEAPADDITLEADELPTFGTITVTP